MEKNEKVQKNLRELKMLISGIFIYFFFNF